MRELKGLAWKFLPIKIGFAIKTVEITPIPKDQNEKLEEFNQIIPYHF